MLSFFPPLYEDELLYSWFARYHIRSCNVSPKATMNDLFGSVNIAVPDLPTHLGMLYERIMHFDIKSLDSLILNHMLFRYYTAFQPEPIREKVYQAMVTGNQPGAIHTMTGIAASVVKEWTFLRFCPTCFKEDIQNKGEPYWHVSHQFPVYSIPSPENNEIKYGVLEHLLERSLPSREFELPVQHLGI